MEAYPEKPWRGPCWQAGAASRGGPRARGAPGLFCAMGIRHDCRMLVDGELNVRTPGARPPRHGGRDADRASARPGDGAVTSFDAVVVVPTAGPAAAIEAVSRRGTSAARGRGGTARRSDLSAACPRLARGKRRPAGADQVASQTLLDALGRLPVTVERSRSLGDLSRSRPGGAPRRSVHPGRGGRARPRHRCLRSAGRLPGLTLPGVVTAGTTGAHQVAQRILPGRRVLLRGRRPPRRSGGLVRGGAEVVGIAEAGTRTGLARLLRRPGVLKGARCDGDLAAGRRTTWARHGIVRAEGRRGRAR